MQKNGTGCHEPAPIVALSWQTGARRDDQGLPMRILLVEDNPRLQELLCTTLRAAGYRVDGVATVGELMASAKIVDYGLLIIDLGLPDGDGLDAIRSIRSVKLAVPILVITARGSVADRVVGLDSGADDYVIKPFNTAELLARVRSILRRPPALLDVVLRAGRVEIDPTTSEVRIDSEVVELRPSERRLLTHLMRRVGAVVPKAALEDALSEFGRELSSNAVEVLVSRLRRVLNEDNAGVTIDTVRGVGYALRAGAP